MRALIMALAVLSPARVFAAGEPKGVERWHEAHPAASKALGDWVKAHPEAVRALFRWQGHRPERSKALVAWAVKRPNEGIETFVAAHKAWPGLDRIADTHRGGVQTYLDWIRKYPEAAEALVAQPKGFEWAVQRMDKHWRSVRGKTKAAKTSSTAGCRTVHPRGLTSSAGRSA